MKRFAMLALLLATPALVLFAADDKPVSPDGTYKLTGLTKGGVKAPEDVTKTYESVTIKGDKMTMKRAGESEKVATIKVESKAKPKSSIIDIAPEDDRIKPMAGIWKLEKNVLTLALIEGKDAKRPADFEGKGKEDILLELTKEEKKEEPKKDK